MSEDTAGRRADGGTPQENVSDRFEQIPETEADRTDAGRPTRIELLDWWSDRFGIERARFEGYTFWEKGAGRIWALHHTLDGAIQIEALGLPILRTRQEFWKPTTEAAQRFGREATKNVVVLDADEASGFIAGTDQDIDWEGDWGYLIAAHEIASGVEPIGVGLFTYGTLQSMVPKGRRREF
jgi:NOL1/NOP2/fmu family ribosome biogenesis protein